MDFCAAGDLTYGPEPRRRHPRDCTYAINGLTKTVELLSDKVDQAIAQRQERMSTLETRIVQAETELRFVKWFGGAVGLGTIALIIERIAGVL